MDTEYCSFCVMCLEPTSETGPSIPHLCNRSCRRENASPFVVQWAQRPVHTHISQSQPQPSVVGAVLRPPLRKSTLGSFLFSSMSLGSVCFLSGLLWVTVGGTSWVSAQKSKEAMLNQIDGLCDFSVRLPGTQLAKCLSAFNHLSLRISPLGLGCIALKQNGIYSGLCH